MFSVDSCASALGLHVFYIGITIMLIPESSLELI